MKIPKFNANQILSKVHSMGDRLMGTSARRYEATASALKSANTMGLNGSRKISDSSIHRMDRLAEVERGRSTQTRVKAGVGVGVTATTGLFGLHKYHQHQDNKIMQRINAMYDDKSK
jgi:hypothetical protein